MRRGKVLLGTALWSPGRFKSSHWAKGKERENINSNSLTRFRLSLALPQELMTWLTILLFCKQGGPSAVSATTQRANLACTAIQSQKLSRPPLPSSTYQSRLIHRTKTMCSTREQGSTRWKTLWTTNRVLHSYQASSLSPTQLSQSQISREHQGIWDSSQTERIPQILLSAPTLVVGMELACSQKQTLHKAQYTARDEIKVGGMAL